MLATALLVAIKADNCPLPVPIRKAQGKPDIPSPSFNQLNWQRNEMEMFVHFGVNTYTGREWGLGDEDPNLFQPTKLNTSQWVEVAQAGGFKSVILVVKHHDGFFLYPNKYTKHTVASSSWRAGKGDVVKDFAASCLAMKMKAAYSLSPWDRNYYNLSWNPKYNQFYLDTMNVLATHYGEFHQLWWDGANAVENMTRVYTWDKWYSLLQSTQPHAVGGGCGGTDDPATGMPLRDCGPDTVWVGTEGGLGSPTSWSFSKPSVEFPLEDPEALQYGPTFCDVSIRDGWFWHPNEKAKSLVELVEIYMRTVGRNCLLQLNVPPNQDGLVDDMDAARVAEFGKYIRTTFAFDYALNGKATASSEMCGSSGHFAVDGSPDTYWIPDIGVHLATLEVQLRKPSRVNLVLLKEHINNGQVISNYTVEIRTTSSTSWTLVSVGTTIGYKKIDRFPEQTVSAVRFAITGTLYDYPFALQALQLHHAVPIAVGNSTFSKYLD